MARIAFYREWRPQTFDEVVAQEQVVFPLRQSVVKGETCHAYLFTGTRGTGKTSLARIYAKAVNCLDPDNGNPCNKCEICLAIDDGSLLDVVEMDAASHNSVENIRRLTDEVLFAPAYARYKVYIIDEAHMLSAGAFNALLKTLEEPPAHAIFILATTEPHRIPATIISRCQRYDFRRIPLEDVTTRLRLIAGSYKIDVTDEALRTMALLAEGTLRDAISLLDQANTGVEGEITRDAVLDLVGLVDDQFLADLAGAILGKRVDLLLALVDQLSLSGRDLVQTVADLARYLRNVLICKISDNPADMIQATGQSLNNMLSLAKNSDAKTIIMLIQGLSSLLNELRWTPDLRTSLEIGLIRLLGDIPDSVIERLTTDDSAVTAKSEPIAKAARQAAAPAEDNLPAESAVDGNGKPLITAACEAMAEDTEANDTSVTAAAKAADYEVDAADAPADAAVDEATDEAAKDAKNNTADNAAYDSADEPADAPACEAMDEAANDAADDSTDGTVDSTDDDPADGEEINDTVAAATLLDHDQLITHWTNILNELNELGHIDILIMARSSHVSYDGTNWYLDFDSTMNSQFERCSMPDATRLLCRLVSQEMEQPVNVIARQNTEAEDNAGATAEPEWLSRIRKVCQDTDVPLEVEEE